MVKLKKINLDNIPNEKLLNKQELFNLLENYTQIKSPDVYNLEKGCKLVIFLKYKIEDKTYYQYQINGYLVDLNEEEETIKIFNNSKTKDYIIKNIAIFRELTIDDLKKEFNEILKEKDQRIKELKLLCQNLERKK